MGETTFTALSNPARCQVYQVRIGGVYALDLKIREDLLDAEPNLAKYLR